MINTNLSTRPFYNTRAVRLWVSLLALVAGLATLVNVVRIIQYARSDSALAQQATRDTEQAAGLRADAARLRSSVDAGQVQRISTEARLANDLIDRRVFSWTELFNLFEQTLPPDVRVTAVRPSVDRDGRIRLLISVIARGVDDVNQFMENLEQTASFRELLSRQEQVNDEDQLEAVLESFYVPPRGAVAVSGVTSPAEAGAAAPTAQDAAPAAPAAPPAGAASTERAR